MLLLSSADFFSKFFFFQEHYQNCLDPDQSQHFAIQCPNCLQRLSADAKRVKGAKMQYFCHKGQADLSTIKSLLS